MLSLNSAPPISWTAPLAFNVENKMLGSFMLEYVGPTSLQRHDVFLSIRMNDDLIEEARARDIASH